MTTVRFVAERDHTDATALVVFVGEDGKWAGAASALDREGNGQLARALAAANFTGKRGKLLELLAPSGSMAKRVLVAGLGDPQKADLRLFEDLGGDVAARLRTAETAAVADFAALPALPLAIDAAAARFAHGFELRNWRIDTYHTRQKEEQKARLERLTVAGAPGAEALFPRLHQLAEGVALTKELVSEPANILYPESFVARVRPLVEPLGVTVTVLGPEELKELGAGCLLGVAQGSARPPRLLALEWNGTGDPDAPVLALVGKGVTFDSGGISLKPGAGMWDMKWDMGGAGAVAGSILALAGRKAKVRVVGVCGLVENMPDGGAQRPGDIVTSLSGQTVEVLNTDAEGRLVLSDCLAWVQRTYKPHTILDFATLTGAIIVSLAHLYAGVFSNSDSLWEKIEAAGAAVDDLVWRQPLSEKGGHYDRMLDSPIADMKNIGGREGGSITAAQFLQRFVDDGPDWAHLDIAGTVWRAKAGHLHDKGATGFGVRLIDQLVASHFERPA